MGVPVLILGASGTGKTYSLRNLPNDGYGLIETVKTMLPFRGGKKFYRTQGFGQIRSAVAEYAERYPIVVVDDFGYAPTSLFMNHIDDRDGYAVYKQIASEVWQTVEFVNGLPGEVIVYITMHVDSDALGNVTPKVMGRMVNEKIDLLGMVNVVLLCDVVDGDHVFVTDGKPPAKSCGALDGPTVPNDLAPVDARLREFMGWSGGGAGAPA